MEETRNETEYSLENLKGKDYLGDLEVDRKIILKKAVP
jgi:hypothetical protein